MTTAKKAEAAALTAAEKAEAAALTAAKKTEAAALAARKEAETAAESTVTGGGHTHTHCAPHSATHPRASLRTLRLEGEKALWQGVGRA